METGQAQNSLALPETSSGVIEWENGQNLLPSASEQYASYLEQSLEQSAEGSQATYSIVECDYQLGDFEGYSLGTISSITIFGVCAGFGLALGVGLLCYTLNKASLAFRKIVEAG